MKQNYKISRSYEEVATYLLNKFSEHFQLERVEGKQKVAGLLSGTTWEIDAKGVKDGDAGFVIVEARRYNSRRLCQEALAGLAFRILDTGAEGGIIVSPLPLQSGAEKIAQCSNVIAVQLDANSTNTDYLMKFLQNVMIGLTESVTVSIPSIVCGSLTRIDE